jgi:hypothetical protein
MNTDRTPKPRVKFLAKKEGLCRVESPKPLEVDELV